MNSPFMSNAYVSPVQAGVKLKNYNKTPAEAQEGFKKALGDALSQVNKAQKESDEMTKKLVTGDVENLHDVMITAEKASVLLQTTIEVRNKALESYQEIMRMQV